jgi:subtilisin family serine protease
MATAVSLSAALAVCLVPAAAQAQKGASVTPPKLPAPDRLRTVDTSADRAPAAAFDRIAPRSADGSVRVIVGLQAKFTPEGGLGTAAVKAQRAEIDGARADVLGAVAGTDHELIHRYQTVPYVALELSGEALQELQDSGTAASIQEDTLSDPALTQSTALVEATESAAVTRTGSGQHIAVLDTGISKTHPFLAGKVVSEACFSATANCPGGVTASTAVGSGVNCTYAVSGCRHGTHVAGIAAGKGATFNGVARDAKLISINVFSRFTGADCAGAGESPCARSFTSDQIKGLDRVFALRNTFRIASVNMSLGGGKSTTNCDADARKPAIDNLRSAGIATVIASGNDGFSDGVGAPSCISTAITVGSTTKTDAVSGFSNSSPLVELLAPGTAINSSVPGGGFLPFDGTSMATPHVAGAWAVMRSVSAQTVPTILGHLSSTGKPATDPDNAVTKPRIRVLTASTRLADTGMRPGAGFILEGGGIASNGVSLATRAGAPATGTINITGIPAGAVVQHTSLYWMTIGGPDSTAVLNGVSRAGTLVGASRDSCWNINQLGANRTYRAVLPLGVVTGNGAYTIGGVGGAAGSDGQGASLVVLYRVPGSPKTGRLIIRHGAVSGVVAGQTMTNVFSGLSVPAAASLVRLHTGMADGQAGTENPLLFNGVAATAANFFSGKDGPLWDDDRLGISAAQLPVGTTSRTSSITVGSDCLAWGYAALGYQH